MLIFSASEHGENNNDRFIYEWSRSGLKNKSLFWTSTLVVVKKMSNLLKTISQQRLLISQRIDIPCKYFRSSMNC